MIASPARRRLPRPIMLACALAFALLAGLGAALAQLEERAAPPSFLERQLQSLVPGLQVEGLQGAWRAAPRADRITLSDSQGVWLVMEDVGLNVAPLSLLRGILRLEALEVARLRVERLPVADPNAPPPDPTAGLLPSLPSLPVDLALDRLAVERLELEPAVAGQAAAFALSGRATLNAEGLTAALALRRLDRAGSAEFDLALAPASDRLRAEVKVAEPEGGLVANLAGRPDAPLALDLTLDGPASGAALTLAASLGQETTLSARGTVRAPATGGYGATLEGEASAAPLLPPDLAPLAFPARFALDAARAEDVGPVRIDRLELTLPAGQAGLTGTLDPATEAAELTLRLALVGSERFAALLPPGIAWRSAAAEVRMTGTLAAPRLAIQARPEGLATGVAEADAVLGPTPTLSGTVALPGPVVDLAVEGAEGRLVVAGTLADPLDATLRLALPRLEVLGAGSEGALEAEAKATGPRADPTVVLTARSGRIATAGRVLEGLTLDARVETPTSAPRAEAALAATLESLPLSLSLRARPEGGTAEAPERVRLEQAEARLGPATLTAEGALALATRIFDGRAKLQAEELAPLGRLAGLAGLEGRLSAEAKLGPRDPSRPPPEPPRNGTAPNGARNGATPGPNGARNGGAQAQNGARNGGRTAPDAARNGGTPPAAAPTPQPPAPEAAGTVLVQGFDVSVEAPRLAYGGNAGRIRAAVDGTTRGFGWSLDAAGEAAGQPGRLAGRGRLDALEDGGWRAELAALQAEAMGETLRLAAPARVTLGADGGVALGQGGVALALPLGGRLQAAGRWGPETAELTVTLSALTAALAARFAPDLAPSGTIAGEVRVTGPVAAPEIRANLRGDGLRSGAPWAAGLPPANLRAEATGKLAGPARLRADLDAGRIGRVTVTAALPRAGAGFGPDAPLEATADGTLALTPLTAPFLAAGADRVDGQVRLALRAGGTIGAPQLGGRATIAGAAYRNPVTGVRISDMNGTITGQGTRLVIERFQGQTAGGGTIALSGGIDLGATGFPADLRLVARNARPVVSDLLTATLDADLRLAGPVLGDARLAGQVTVQRAEIRIPTSLPASVPVLENVQVRGRPPPGAILPPSARAAARRDAGAAEPAGGGLPPIALDLRVAAPQQVFIRGRGADVELGGLVRVGGTLAAPIPSGGLELRRGTLDVLARRLTFDRGRIDFASGTLIPRLDLLARAQTRSATITIAIQGPPTDPKVTFTSSPELPQDEILARLLFDRPTSGLSPFEIAQIAEAIAQLTGIGGGGGAAALDKVRSALGLDRLGVGGGTEAGAGPSLEAGRYVAPGVYIGLRQGVQGGQTGVGVEVELTPRLRLEGQTATGAAGDRVGVTYQLEY